MGYRFGAAVTAEQLTPEEIFAEVSRRYDTVKGWGQITSMLGLREDLLPDLASVDPLPEQAPAAATVMLVVLLTLVDTGYSFDQALEGLLFGEVSFGDVAPGTGCVFLANDFGLPVEPEGSGTGVFPGSEVAGVGAPHAHARRPDADAVLVGVIRTSRTSPGEWVAAGGEDEGRADVVPVGLDHAAELSVSAGANGARISQVISGGQMTGHLVGAIYLDSFDVLPDLLAQLTADAQFAANARAMGGHLESRTLFRRI